MEPDGAIFAYRWVDRELLEEWIDFCMAADPDQVRLLFANGRFAIKTEAGKSYMISFRRSSKNTPMKMFR